MFQPTLPLRGATPGNEYCRCRRTLSTHAPLAGSDALGVGVRARGRVSTHAPLAGSDAVGDGKFPPDVGFNPRSPCGERLPQLSIVNNMYQFQPTLPLRGATATSC